MILPLRLISLLALAYVHDNVRMTGMDTRRPCGVTVISCSQGLGLSASVY